MEDGRNFPKAQNRVGTVSFLAKAIDDAGAVVVDETPQYL